MDGLAPSLFIPGWENIPTGPQLHSESLCHSRQTHLTRAARFVLFAPRFISSWPRGARAARTVARSGVCSRSFCVLDAGHREGPSNPLRPAPAFGRCFCFPLSSCSRRETCESPALGVSCWISLAGVGRNRGNQLVSLQETTNARVSQPNVGLVLAAVPKQITFLNRH